MVSSLTKPQVLYQPFAETGDKNTILNAPDAENPQLANLQTGFPPITQTPIDNGGIPPERKDFNGLGNLLSSFYYFVQNGGVYTFEQDVSDAIGGYPNGAILYYTDGNGVTYRVKSNKANNTDNFVSTPAFIGDSWDIVSDTPQDLMPYIGDIKASVRTANHGNWFICNGQAISRSTYATLFSIIGTTYGDGDGSTTFNLPDYTGSVVPTDTTLNVMGNGNALSITDTLNNQTTAWVVGNHGSGGGHYPRAWFGSSSDTPLSVGSQAPTGTDMGTVRKVVGVSTLPEWSGLTGSFKSSIATNYFIKVL